MSPGRKNSFSASRTVLQTFSWRDPLSLLSGYQESAGHVASLVLLRSHVIHFAMFQRLRVRSLPHVCYTAVHVGMWGGGHIEGRTEVSVKKN